MQPTAAPAASNVTSGKTLGVPISVKTFVSEETFQCEAHDLYEVLTDQQRVTAFTSGTSKVEPFVGGK